MINPRLKDIIRDEKTASARPTIVSFMSGKGGTGKTVLVYNLAVVMADSGLRCLLIDSDWYFGNVHILANVSPAHTLFDQINARKDDEKHVIALNENLDFMASPASADKPVEFDPEAYVKFLSGLPQSLASYDFILIDTPSGLVDIIRPTALVSDINFIIINPEWTSIADGYGLYKYLILANNDFLAHIFLNKADNREDYDYIYQKFTVLAEKFLNRIPFGAGYLIDDQDVIESVKRQLSILKISPDSTAVKRLNRLVRLLVDERKSGGRFKQIKVHQVINSQKLLADIRK